MNDPISDGLGTLVLVRGEDHGAAGHPRAGEKLVEEVTAVLVEAGMGLVEQPEPCAAGDEHGERGAALLAGRAPPDRRRGEAPAEAELLERRADPRLGPPGGPHREAQVLLNGQLLVQEGLVAEHADLAPNGASVDHEVAAEHERLSRVHRQQTGEDLEQAGLARPVRAAKMYHLAFADFQEKLLRGGG